MAPAVAAGTVPVPVPLDGVEKSLNVSLPKAGGELPLLMPGVPQVPKLREPQAAVLTPLPQTAPTGVLGLGSV
ncbi:hypothetical protein QFZ49_000607 [Streptomyces turgidiscabies]|uniref:Secreted protein n=1 Tax=Streptomyces turgidiscabies TaxID=85558 RepID=A0ABU0RFF4_9ACTN|nr:hypothetical protein [Streptomyces turgidiscabies]